MTVTETRPTAAAHTTPGRWVLQFANAVRLGLTGVMRRAIRPANPDQIVSAAARRAAARRDVDRLLR